MTTVCMATYNGARFIREQIDSILPQLGAKDELIISDDGSTDGTLEILAEYAVADARVKVLNHGKNPAYVKIRHSRNFYYATDNFENTLRQAKGDYIFLADQDDVWRKDKVERVLELLKSSDSVMHNYQIVDENDKVVKMISFSNVYLSKSLMYNLIKTPFLGCCMAFNRKVLNTVLPFPKNLIAHDLWIGCIGSKFFTFRVTDEILVNHRIHSANTSNVGKKSKNPFFWKIAYRIKLLFCMKNFWR